MAHSKFTQHLAPCERSLHIIRQKPETCTSQTASLARFWLRFPPWKALMWALEGRRQGESLILLRRQQAGSQTPGWTAKVRFAATSRPTPENHFLPCRGQWRPPMAPSCGAPLPVFPIATKCPALCFLWSSNDFASCDFLYSMPSR